MTILNEAIQPDREKWLEFRESGNEILRNCLQLAGQSDDPEETLNSVCAWLGSRIGSDRVFIFELSQNRQLVSNSFEWCNQGIRSQQELMQEIPAAETRFWLDMIRQEHCFLIDDLEKLREEKPGIYTCLKPQGIHSVAAARILKDGDLDGFWGFDNPDPEMLPALRSVLEQLERLMSMLVERVHIFREMKDVELRDPVTGFYSLKAMYRHHNLDENPRTLAVIYARLENSPDLEDLIRKIGSVREKICTLMDTRRIYRITPTEFVAVYPRVERDWIERRRRAIKRRFTGSEIKVQVGSAWSNQPSAELGDLIRTAVRWSCLYGNSSAQETEEQENPLIRYLEKDYFDLDFFLRSITADNDSACFFFGDIQESVFYISENMRRKFGFASVLVPELMYGWADRISGYQAQRRYWKELRHAIDKGLDFCTMNHQVLDAGGRREWVHLYVEFKWNKDRSDVLFCSGRITMQDKSLAVDTETRFGLETVLARHLEQLRQSGRNCYFIGFSLNNLEKINDMEGRAYGNNLIHSVSEAMAEQFRDRADFYKLSGMRFAVLIRPEFESIREEMIDQMRQIIEEKYTEFSIRVPDPCSFVLTRYPQGNLEPLDFIECITSSIRSKQQEGGKGYLDCTVIDVERMRADANLSLELSRDVLSQMRNFRMVVQPVVEAEDSRVQAGEALLRWNKDGRDVSPGVFIPILEKENMMIRVGRWVFEESVKACRRMVSLEPSFRLSINVSLQQLEDDGLQDFMEKVLQKYEVDGSHLVIEMTESCMDSAQEKLMQLVLFCTSHGIPVALDDFGTGYSSMRVLMQYPTTIIKLDRSLLLEMSKSEDKKNFISSIVFACHQFGKRVCIEGVETGEQDMMVREAECDMIQGFFHYRPMELEDVYTLLARQGQKAAEPALES